MKHSRRAASLIAGALLATSCTGGDSLVTVRPEMALDPEAGTEIVFDQAVLGSGEVAPRIVKVTNVGEGPLIIDGAEIRGPNADAFWISSTPSTLAPNQTGEMFIRFEPSVPGDLTAEVVMRSNDPARREVTWPLRGPSRETCTIRVTPGHQKFLLGEVRQITITNTSTFQCEITRLFTDESLFAMQNAPELPFVIPVGSAVSIDLQYIRVPNTVGIPLREFRVKESEGTEAVVTLEGEPPVSGCFVATPDQIIFRNTIIGQTRQRFVTVTNNCSKVASVTSVSVGEGYYFFEVDRSAFPVDVQPRTSIEIPVTYLPFSPDGDGGWLYVNTNDALNSQFRIRLYGEASIPDIETFPRNLDFGNVVYKNPQGPEMRSECASRSLDVNVYSTGGAPLTISNLEIDAAGDQLFLITGAILEGQPVMDINQPIEIPPEQSLQVSIQFFPVRDDPALHRGRLLIEHNGSQDGMALTEIQLRGSGALDGVVTDTFQQPEGPMVDILWVIDDSCSMYDEQARLIQNLSQFVAYADSQSADYQMAVTDTDSLSSQAGKFERCFPHPAVISSTYETSEIREEAFECTFDVGTTGTGHEAGLGAAMRALERVQDPDLEPNLNAGFLRDEANLAIVVMSDEDDQSLQSNELLKSYFSSVKGEVYDPNEAPNRVTVHAIAGPTENACETGIFNAAPGYRYREVALSMGGIFFDICQEDWQPVLDQLGLDVFVPINEWQLSQAADPGSLIVTVDGVATPRSATDGYTYSALTNTITFHGSGVPPPGAQVDATYSGLCRP